MKRQKLITALAELWDWNLREIGDLLPHNPHPKQGDSLAPAYEDATRELAFFHFGHDTLDLLTNRKDEDDDDFEEDFEDDDDFEDDLEFDEDDFDEDDDLDWDSLDEYDDLDLDEDEEEDEEDD